MYIDKIAEIVAKPADVQSVMPEQVNCKLGVELPEDYYRLVNTYGAGTFAEFINILVPYTSDFEFNLYEFIKTDRENYLDNQDFIESMGSDDNDPRIAEGWKIGEPFNYYPDENGLIPWGKYPYGNDYTFYWNTSPDKWTVVVYDDMFGYKEYDMSATEFLYALFTGSIILDIAFDTSAISFVSYSEE